MARSRTNTKAPDGRLWRTLSLQERFNCSYERDSKTTCWVWKNADHGDGYGRMRVGARMIRAHRVSYMLAYGPIPSGLLVLHKCNNARCVNPHHLYLGNDSDNTKDKIHAGRCNPSLGESNGASKITEGDVRYIRRSNKSNAVLARELNVSKAQISAIKNRRSWKHIQ